MRKKFLRIGSVAALLAVALGAFGSHGLTQVIDPEQLATFEIGVRYHFFHAIAIIAVAILLYFGKKPFLIYAAWCFTGGIVLFSGSLYLLSLKEQFPFSSAWAGPLTPLGGTLFIAGWALLFLASYQQGNYHHNGEEREKAP
jgi:uncharacterized membrane protein YgdD (TMEM256/DUF423 family)